MNQQERTESLQRQLTIHGKNLNRLEEQKAEYGIDVPLNIWHGSESWEVRLTLLVRTPAK